VQGAVCFGASEERAYSIIDEVRGIDGDDVSMCQLPQLLDLGQHFLRGKEVWCSADLYLGAQKDSRHRPGKYDLVDCIIPTLDPAAGQGTHHLHRNAFISRISDMLTLGNPSHQEPPLSVEESGIESRVIAIRGQAQQINIRLGHREIVIVARLIDKSKYAIGDTNGIENEK
jgi:hypothetical protein